MLIPREERAIIILVSRAVLEAEEPSTRQTASAAPKNAAVIREFIPFGQCAYNYAKHCLLARLVGDTKTKGNKIRVENIPSSTDPTNRS